MSLQTLLVPSLANFIKDFPASHAVTADAVDDYAGACLTSDALTSYTPTLSSTGTAPVLGTGATIRGYYYRIFDQIWTWGDFRFGASGFSFGTGSYKISLPFDVKSYMAPSAGPGFAPILGMGYLIDSSAVAGRQSLTCQLASPNEIMFNIKADSAGAASRTVIGANSPITWATNDGISWFAKYKRVDQ